MGLLEGQRALVTGAGRGLGRAIARELAAAGACVCLTARSADQLGAVRKDIGDPSVAISGDLADPAFVSDLIGRAEAACGPLDILVNNAGIAPSAPVGRTSDEAWNEAMSLNASVPFRLSRAAIEGMRARGRGRIVNVASTAALKGYPYTAAYVASKHALLGLTRALAVELAGDGITVNAVCPGFADTEIARDAIENIMRATGRDEDAARAALTADAPLGRLVRPEEVARAVMVFLGPDSDAITGQALAVAGGAA